MNDINSSANSNVNKNKGSITFSSNNNTNLLSYSSVAGSYNFAVGTGYEAKVPARLIWNWTFVVFVIVWLLFGVLISQTSNSYNQTNAMFAQSNPTNTN